MIGFTDYILQERVNNYIEKTIGAYAPKEIKKEDKNMNMFDGNLFEGMTKKLNGLFGKIGPDMCRITMGGEIAIKTSDGYKTYNLKKKRLTNVSNFCFDIGNMFFVMPTCQVKKGDVILVGGRPKCVLRTDLDDEDGDNAIKVIDYETNEIRTIIPERHVFMRNTYFYGKITPLFRNILKGKNPKGIMGTMLKMAMMQQVIPGLLGGKVDTNGGMGGMMQMMMMSQMFGGGMGGMFGGLFGGDDDGAGIEDMFDLKFGVEDDVDDEEDDEEDEPKAKKKPAKKPAKKKPVEEEDEEE